MKKIILAATLAAFVIAVFWTAAALAAGSDSKTLPAAKGPMNAGEKTKDPVCGMDITVSDKTPSSEFQGTTYYFCSADCKKEFDANPQKYTEKDKK